MGIPQVIPLSKETRENYCCILFSSNKQLNVSNSRKVMSSQTQQRAQGSSLTSRLFFQNEWTEAVDTSGRDGTPDANGDGS